MDSRVLFCRTVDATGIHYPYGEAHRSVDCGSASAGPYNRLIASRLGHLQLEWVYRSQAFVLQHIFVWVDIVYFYRKECGSNKIQCYMWVTHQRRYIWRIQLAEEDISASNIMPHACIRNKTDRELFRDTSDDSPCRSR